MIFNLDSVVQGVSMNQDVLIITLIGAAVIIAALAICIFFRSSKKRRQALNEQFGKKPSPNRDLESVTAYWDARLSQQDIGYYIDDTTWNDLDMNKVYQRIDACQTSVGDEYLYAMLRQPVFEQDELSDRENLISILEADPKLRLDIQVILSKMGKLEFSGLASFCYESSKKKIKHSEIFVILAVLPILMLGVIFLNAAIGGIGLLISVITNGLVYYITKLRIARELTSVRYFASLLWCVKKMKKVCPMDSNPILRDMASSYNVFKKLGGKMSGMTRLKLTDIDYLIEYIRIFFLTSIRNYNKVLSVMEKNEHDFRLLYQSFGELDAAISVLSFRKSMPYYTLPDFIAENRTEIKDIYHPLISDPVPNSLMLSKSNLISGSNASGKSTFLKAVAVNGILAQTIYTCTAKVFRLRLALVMTSMAVREDITAKESYFIAEIKSLKRIVERIPKVHCVCVIDEILKGTNTVERIAASATILRELHKMDCLCIVATHDTELTRLLSDGYDNYHFSEQISDQGIYFDYTIKEGPALTKNAIKLLDFYEFDKKIVSSAEKLVRGFEETKRWEE